MAHQSVSNCPVLIVEDDADLREMMAQLLALEGFHTTAVANAAYLYRARIASAEQDTANTSPDLATTVIFTDPVLSSNAVRVKAGHFFELRTAVNAVRALAGLGPAAFPEPLTADSTPIKLSHLQELRGALDPARSMLSLSPIVYTRPSLSVGTSGIAAVDVEDLRTGVEVP